MTTGSRLCAILGAATAAALLLFPGQAAGAPGDFDPSFGTDGVVQTQIGRASIANAIALQPDGKIVLGGWSDRGVSLARYLPDGTLDPGFGSGGIVTSAVGVADDGLAIQPDGKLVLAVSMSSSGFTVVRYDADGRVDTSFGSGGVTHVPGVNAAAVVVQPDGRIVVVGSSQGPGYSYRFLVARFEPDGSPDHSFGTDGVVKTQIGGSSRAVSVALQPDGKIVVGGTSATDQGQIDGVAAMARYSVDGSLDQSFGSGGTVATLIPTNSEVGSGLALQPDGKIVVGGNGGPIVLGRYLPDGSLDTSFGAGGTATAGSISAGARDVRVQADGKIVVAGSGARGFVVLRFEGDGNLDLGFGDDGAVTTTFGWYGTGNAVAVQPDGRIVAAGYAGSNEGWQFAVLRLLVTTPSTITGQPLEVDYGRPIQLSGTLTTRQAGPVTLLRRRCYDFSRSVEAPLEAGNGGEWATHVIPRSRTLYWAAVGTDRSRPITVAVRPRLTLRRLSRRLVRARVLFGHSLAGEILALQRRPKGSLSWEDIGIGTLKRVASGRTGVVSGVAFRIPRSVNGRLRVQIRQTTRYDCFAEAASGSIR